MKLLGGIHHGSSRIMDLGVAAGNREVGRTCGIKGQVGYAIGSKVVLYFLRLTRNGLCELGEPGCHVFARVSTGRSSTRHVVHWRQWDKRKLNWGR
jgi:hypothetical protein